MLLRKVNAGAPSMVTRMDLMHVVLMNTVLLVRLLGWKRVARRVSRRVSRRVARSVVRRMMKM